MSSLALCILPWLAGLGPAGSDIVKGSVDRRTHEHGEYVLYTPQKAARGLLVLIHGSLGKDESAIAAAETYLTRWTELAEQRGLLVLAPAFDQENFGGQEGPGGGYRGLFGRRVGADDFVNALVDELRQSYPQVGEKFHLYGHSAGGQFVSRYLVMHPERVKSAVISAAGTFAFPDPHVPWTNGMQPLTRRMRWSDHDDWNQINIAPDPSGWLKASQIPIAVVVGERDTQPIKEIPGNPGTNHVERARNWVQSMRKLARDNGKSSRVRLVEVKGVGHNSERLTPASQQALF